MAGPRPSSADLLALRRAGRGKILAMIGLAVCASAAAIASFVFDPGGQGNPDDPTRILVVTQGQPPGYSVRLRDWGFEAAEGSFVSWTQRAQDELDDPPPSDVAAVLALADRFGYGYVVFEHPDRIDFDAAGIEGLPDEFGSGTRFAAVSVGDLGEPSRLTVHDPPPPSVRDSSLLLLKTLFRQPELDALKVVGGPGGLSNLELRDRLHAGLDQLDRLPRAHALVEETHASVQRIVAASRPGGPPVEPMGFATELSVALPLADGSTLVAGRGYSLISHDAVRVQVAFDDQEYLRVVGQRESLANGRLCPAPAGPVVPPLSLPRIAVAADGHSVGVKTPAGRLQVWVLDSEGDCRLQGLGTFDPPSIDEVGEPVLGKDHVAWSGQADGAAVVALVSLRDRTRTLLGLIDGHRFEAPVWLDGNSLLVVDRSADGLDGVAFFDLEHPLVVPRLDASGFHGAEGLQAVTYGRDGSGDFLVAVVTGTDRLYRADLPSGWRAAFDAVTKSSAAPGRPAFVALDTNFVRVTALLHRGKPYSPTIAPGGRWLSFGWNAAVEGDQPNVVALMDLADPDSVTSLADNQWFGVVPRFVPDGSRLVFSTGFAIPNTNTHVITARMVSLPR